MKTREKIIVIVAVVTVMFLVGYIAGYSAHESDEKPAPEITTKTNVITKDTTVYNYDYRDTTIYDKHLKPITDFRTDTVHDTVYVAIPISQYHFGINNLADIYVSGYDVTLDSTNFHLKEIHTVQTVTLKEPKYRNFIGADVGFYDASILYIRQFGRISVGFSAGYTYDRHATAHGVVGWNF